MKKLNKIFTTKVKLIIGTAILITTIAFTQVSQSGVVCNSVRVIIENNHDNHFLTDADVVNIATENGIQVLEGEEIEKINLKGIEVRLNENPYIDNGQIFKDLQGKLILNVRLKRPVARIIRSNGPDSYITENGDQMPVSRNFVSRVLLVRGTTLDSLNTARNFNDALPEYFEMINHIRRDEFWKMQIAEMMLKNDGQLVLIPQVTKQLIEFGDPEFIEEKFRKLRVFYKEVLPREGWNKYKRVNLEYEQQIIAE